MDMTGTVVVSVLQTHLGYKNYDMSKTQQNIALNVLKNKYTAKVDADIHHKSIDNSTYKFEKNPIYCGK